MSDFERISYYYSKGWATEQQLQQYVKYGVITTEQYEKIMNPNYQSPEA